jgi:squalene synthase HpnD
MQIMTTSDTIEARAYATATVKRAHTSFYWAMRLLEPQKRNAMFAIYAFCRVVDDVADNPGQSDAKRACLQSWRQEIDDTFAGNPSGPVGRALFLAIGRFDLVHADFLAIIDGVEMDVGDDQIQGRVRIIDLAELILYCDRVACAVGRLSAQVFGLDLKSQESLGVSLGRALQLTNILRDLMEDAAIDRLYLPREMLKFHGIEATEPLDVFASPAIVAVCVEIALMAEQYFVQSDVILSGLQRAQVRPAIIMSEVYKRILGRLNTRGWKDLNTSVSLSRLTKAWIAIRYGYLGA